MAKPINVNRAPRGTKVLAKAFFSAADEIPEPQRAAVTKAALALIRDEMRTMREKAAVAKAKAKAKTAKAPAMPERKTASTGKSSGKTEIPMPAMKKAVGKAPASAKAPAAGKAASAGKAAATRKAAPKRPKKAAAPPPMEPEVTEPSPDSSVASDA